MIRIRTDDSGPYRTNCSRREMLRRLVDEGFVFFKTRPKHRYVNFVGDKDTVHALRKALKWDVLPYPKRQDEPAERRTSTVSHSARPLKGAERPSAGTAECGETRSPEAARTK